MTQAERDLMKAWLEDHGVDWRLIPDRFGGVAVGYSGQFGGEPELHFTQMVTDEKGQFVVDHAAGEVVRRPRIVPLRREPPIRSRKRASVA